MSNEKKNDIKKCSAPGRVRIILSILILFSFLTLSVAADGQSDEAKEYWQIKEVNIFYIGQKPLIKVSVMPLPDLLPDRSEKVFVNVTNLDEAPLNVTGKLEVPTGWSAKPAESTQRNLSPNNSVFLNFSVTPSPDVKPGTYTLTLKMTGGDQEFTVFIPVVVRERTDFLFWLVISIIIISCVLAWTIWYLRREEIRTIRKLRMLEKVKRAK